MPIPDTRNYVCADCGSPNKKLNLETGAYRDSTLDHYMVLDSVWAESQSRGQDLLHLHCLERRLGRELTIEDFTPAPINNMIRFGFEMGKQATLRKF